MPNTWSTAGVGCCEGERKWRAEGPAPKHSTSSFPSFPAWGKYVELSQINSEHYRISAPRLLLPRICPGFCHVQELPTRCLLGQDSGQSVAASGLVTKFALLLDLRGDLGCMWSPVRTAGRSALGSGACGLGPEGSSVPPSRRGIPDVSVRGNCSVIQSSGLKAGTSVSQEVSGWSGCPYLENGHIANLLVLGSLPGQNFPFFLMRVAISCFFV